MDIFHVVLDRAQFASTRQHTRTQDMEASIAVAAETLRRLRGGMDTQLLGVFASGFVYEIALGMPPERLSANMMPLVPSGKVFSLSNPEEKLAFLVCGVLKGSVEDDMSDAWVALLLLAVASVNGAPEDAELLLQERDANIVKLLRMRPCLVSILCGEIVDEAALEECQELCRCLAFAMLEEA